MAAENPFADFGMTVSGDRFVGREEELRQIDSRLFGKGGYGSLALVGLPRIGKTSLLAEAVRRAKPRLKEIRAVVLRIDVGACRSIDDLFHIVIEDLVKGLQEETWSSPRVESRAARVLEHPISSFTNVRDVFRSVRQDGVRAICILDEFDASRYLFAGAPQCFHWLRELCSNPDFKAAIVLVSKRRMQDVSRIAGHDSDYWANVLMPLTLRPFTPEETEQLGRRLKDFGVSVDQETVHEVEAVCGRHPYLLDAYSYYAWQRVSQGAQVGVEWFRTSIRGIVRDYYQQVITILRDASILDKFIQVILGPQWNVVPDDVDAMIDYGVLSADNRLGLRSFSDAFDNYVRIVEGSKEIWPLWRDTEQALRDAIEARLQGRFGVEWQEEIRKARPKLGVKVDQCREMMAREQARFGARAATALLAYTYPMDLYDFMTVDWPALGEPLLGPDKQGWSIKFGVLAKVRTPLAHNRLEAVTEGERLQAAGICTEILERMRAYQSREGG